MWGEQEQQGADQHQHQLQVKSWVKNSKIQIFKNSKIVPLISLDDIGNSSITEVAPKFVGLMIPFRSDGLEQSLQHYIKTVQTSM